MKKSAIVVFIILILSMVAMVVACGGSSGDGSVINGLKMTSFSFKASLNSALDGDMTGTIDNTEITVIVPTGTSVIALRASFKHDGEFVTVNGVEQIGGATRNSFANPVVYVINGSDGSSTTYIVTVNNPGSGEGDSGEPYSEYPEELEEEETGEGDEALATLRAPDAQAKDNFGKSIAIDSGRIIAGAPKEDGGSGDPAMNAGTAYIFELVDTTWSPATELRASDKAISDGFGHTVDISGSYAIVGAFQEDGGTGDSSADCGAAYIFARDDSGEWLEEFILRASDATSLDYFGVAVAISGSTAIVGAYYENGGEDDPDTYAGAAYIFERDASGDWLETSVLRASDMLSNKEGDYFGYTLDIDGDTAIVGAYGAMYNDGAAYIFERDAYGEWNETAILKGSDIGTNNQNRFGYAVAISRDTVAISALHKDNGAVYIFQRDVSGDWNETAILTASDATTGDLFGFSLAIDGDNLAIGAVGEDGGNEYDIESAGAVYLFTRDVGDNWIQTQEIHKPVMKPWDLFGAAVDISGDTIVSGAYMSDGDIENPVLAQGAVYVY